MQPAVRVQHIRSTGPSHSHYGIMTKLDISSTTLDKGLEVAKQFLDKLVAPAAEEVGLLLRDTVAQWRFRNQVRVLTRSKAFCDANGITPSAISLKLLCPLLENASLEEDETMQDKWATLLANLADSEQNIQNHVFPYILSQLSKNEFLFLEQVLAKKFARAEGLTRDLAALRAERPERERALRLRLAELDEQLRTAISAGELARRHEHWSLQTQKLTLETQLRALDSEQSAIEWRIRAPEPLPEVGLAEYELSNTIRLGLVQFVQETYAEPQTLEIPVDREYQYSSGYMHVKLQVELQSEQAHVLTELGELFFVACMEKRHLPRDHCRTAF